MVMILSFRKSQKEHNHLLLRNYPHRFSILFPNVPLSSRSRRVLTRLPRHSIEASRNSSLLLLMLTLLKLYFIFPSSARKKYCENLFRMFHMFLLRARRHLELPVEQQGMSSLSPSLKISNQSLMIKSKWSLTSAKDFL